MSNRSRIKNELTPAAKAAHSIHTTYRKKLWAPFQTAIGKYELIQPGDKIAVCISGGKDSMLMAEMMREYQKYMNIPFEVVYLVMDPGYNEANRRKIEENAARLDLPITVFETNIFAVANHQTVSPCYLCARMRRGHLYNKAKELGCNKIALGHHFNDVIETVVMAMFYSSKIETIIPKAKSENFEGMELIRPMYCVHEDDIIAWAKYNGLEFIQCACRFTESARSCDSTSKRLETKKLIRELKKNNPEIEQNIFNAVHSVQLKTFPGYKDSDNVFHSFLENYSK